MRLALQEMAAGLLAEGADARGADCGVGHVGDGFVGCVVLGVVSNVFAQGSVSLASEKVASMISPLAISGQPIGAFKRRC